MEREGGGGRVFGPDAGFLLRDGSMRAPDAAWIPAERWAPVAPKQRERFLPLCPDFVVERRSWLDRPEALREKMEAWRANGCRLGWLLDPYERKAFVYRADHGGAEALESDEAVLDGESVLPGFRFETGAWR